MRRIFDTAHYQLRVYLKSNRPVMPFALLLLLVGLLYAVMPVLPADSYAASATLLCFLAAWIGFASAGAEDPVSEQLLALRLGGMVRLELAHTLFLLLVGVAAAALATVQPLLVYIVHGGALYKEPVTVQTVLLALLLHGCAAFMGTATGAFFHPRYFPDRKVALLLISFALILGFVAPGLHRLMPVSAVITWAFPPIAGISQGLSGLAAFTPSAVWQPMLRLALYGAALTAARIALLARLRFS